MKKRGSPWPAGSSSMRRPPGRNSSTNRRWPAWSMVTPLAAGRSSRRTRYEPSGLRAVTRPKSGSVAKKVPSAPKMASSGPTMPLPSGENTSWAPVSMSMAVTCEANTCVTYSRPSGPNVMPLAPPSRLGGVTVSRLQPDATCGAARRVHLPAIAHGAHRRPPRRSAVQLARHRCTGPRRRRRTIGWARGGRERHAGGAVQEAGHLDGAEGGLLAHVVTARRLAAGQRLLQGVDGDARRTAPGSRW